MTKLNYPRIVEWAQTRGILDQSTAQFQMLKATEEHGELASAILTGNRDERIDAIGDQLVVAIVQAAQLGYDVGNLLDCVKFDVPHSYVTGEVICLRLTVAQGELAADLARSRCAQGSLIKVFQCLANVCSVYGDNASEALDSVYEIISKRGGEMRNGVWIKSEDL